MKTIELIQGEKFSSKEVLIEVMSVPTVQGFTIAEMRKRLKIIDKIEAANGSLDLEDTDFELLKAIFTQHKFIVAHKDLVDIASSVEV